MKSVFISYSGKDSTIIDDLKDRDIVDSLVDIFKHKGIDYFLDTKNIDSTAETKSEINEGMKKYDTLMVILTKNSSTSDWVKTEIDFGIERKKNDSNFKIFILDIYGTYKFLPIDDAIRQYTLGNNGNIEAIIPIKGQDKNAIYNSLKQEIEKSSYFTDIKSLWEHLQISQVELLSINKKDFEDTNKPKKLIWLVVSRRKLTVIHYAQIEVIKLLKETGWKIKIVIINLRNGDSGFEASKDNKNFNDLLKNRLSQRCSNLDNIEIGYHSDFLRKRPAGYLKTFFEFAGDVKVSSLLGFYNKDFSEIDIEKNRAKETINLLRPLFTCALALHLNKQEQTVDTSVQCYFLAGQDERQQWTYLSSVKEEIEGAILIPILKMEGKNSTKQDASVTHYGSYNEMREGFKKGNNLFWLLSMFYMLPDFGNKKEKFQISAIERITQQDIGELRDSFDKSNFYKKIAPYFDRIAKEMYKLIYET